MKIYQDNSMGYGIRNYKSRMLSRRICWKKTKEWSFSTLLQIFSKRLIRHVYNEEVFNKWLKKQKVKYPHRLAYHRMKHEDFPSDPTIAKMWSIFKIPTCWSPFVSLSSYFGSTEECSSTYIMYTIVLIILIDSIHPLSIPFPILHKLRTTKKKLAVWTGCNIIVTSCHLIL